MFTDNRLAFCRIRREHSFTFQSPFSVVKNSLTLVAVGDISLFPICSCGTSRRKSCFRYQNSLCLKGRSWNLIPFKYIKAFTIDCRSSEAENFKVTYLFRIETNSLQKDVRSTKRSQRIKPQDQQLLFSGLKLSRANDNFNRYLK